MDFGTFYESIFGQEFWAWVCCVCATKSHVNVAFGLVPLKRLNSVKLCDKMRSSSLVFASFFYTLQQLRVGLMGNNAYVLNRSWSQG